ncbi:FecR family protein [Aliifodinibius salipaludis]|uniref:FecR family protein n=1 Tax=Fodinibius salipaludis TaxID=2032627 RepID=UPI0011409A52|nr:FecR domain-containing protein [Aliifodinibius salipaludis]
MSNHDESIENLLSSDSFVGWIEGTATDEEGERWQTWVEDDPARKKLVQKAKVLHQNIEFSPGKHTDVESELDRLYHRLREEEQSSKSKIFNITRRTYYSSVAAIVILLIAVMGVIGYMNPEIYSETTAEESQNKFVTNTTTDGQKKQLTLSDGSKITLNANSRIKYPAEYYGGDLDIWLEGEAFFDIVHFEGEAERSLTVHVTEGSIKVLGTKFNVNTYEDATEVVLVEGSVRVEKKNSENEITEDRILKRGEMSRIPQVGQEITVNQVRSELFTAWTEDKLIFDNTPLREVIRRVEHLYDVRFDLDDQELENTPISGSLPNNNLEVFINALENLMEQPVMKDGNIIKVGALKSKREDQ